eukprot:TRINITY_DN3590_c0_g1_i1.p1 TRINITY_DN3590_c0_g1~~TRINITY_DN3590_c0_g1_i1.p1  ORF type:complete len:1957 (-),score=534.48 TRINITY_DN3590_c0_g1_i1:30-5876(-)
MEDQQTQDLNLLDRVLLRLATAADDAQLQDQLAKLLVPILQKLNSTYDTTRNKVIEVLTHINKRTRPQPNVKLPLKDLVNQYLDPASSIILKNFNMIYLEMAFQRAPLEQTLEVTPDLLLNISQKSPQHKTIILHLILPIIDKLKFKAVESTTGLELEKVKQAFEFFKSSADKEEILSFFLDFLLLPPDSVLLLQKIVSPSSSVPTPAPALSLTGLAPTTSASNSDTPQAHSEEVAVEEPPEKKLHGLSINALKRALSKNTFSFQQLTDLKMGILRFLSNASLDDNDVLLHYLVASCDANHVVQRKGEDELKRLSKLNLENLELITKLYSLYSGTYATTKNVQDDDRRNSASFAVKCSVLNQLSRSTLATNRFPHTLQLLFDAIHGPQVVKNASRLRQNGIIFCNNVIQKASDTQISRMSPLLLQGIIKLIGHLEINNTDSNSTSLRGQSYVTLGLLGKRQPDLFTKDLSILFKLFAALGKEDTSVRPSIQEALTALCVAYENPLPEICSPLENLLLNAIERTDHQSRYMVQIYANRIFPHKHITARYLNLLATGDSKNEVKEEAKRGLKPYRHRDHDLVPDDTVPSPPFADLIMYISSALRVRISRQKKNRTAGTSSLPFSPQVYENMLLFLRRCLHTSARDSKENIGKHLSLLKTKVFPIKPFSVAKTEEDATDDGVVAMDQVDEDVADVFGREKSVLELYQVLIDLGITGRPDNQLLQIASESLFELLLESQNSASPLSREYATKIQIFKNQLKGGRPETRDGFARLIGYALPECEKEVAKKTFEELISTLESGADYDHMHGAICAIGFSVARLAQLPSGSEILDGEVVKKGIVLLYKHLVHSSSLIVTSSIVSLGYCCLYSPLPFPDGHVPETLTADDKLPKPQDKDLVPATKIDIIKRMASLLSSQDTKVIEKASVGLSCVSLGESRGSPLQTYLLSCLVSVSTNRHEEVQFAIGEALTCLGASHLSTASVNPFRLPPLPSLSPSSSQDQPSEETPMDLDGISAENNEASLSSSSSSSDGAMAQVVAKVLEKILHSSHTHEQASATIWLLSLVRFSGNHPVIQRSLPKFQQLFSQLLGHTNDVIQEVASRGLVLVYEHSGDKGSKGSLVSALVETLTQGKKMVKVSDDTQLFPEGALGTSPTGENLTTYKELCSLATEMGKPELMYKFMDLASHHALWNSKKGAAFAAKSLLGGKGIMAAEAAKELEAHLPNLLPKLYRASYDPNSRIAQSMSSILKAVAPEGRKTLDRYFAEISKEILDGLGQRGWRVREASCLALADLISGRDLKEVQDFLGSWWEAVFRVMDDIKESVKRAGVSAAKGLSSLSLRLCDNSLSGPTTASAALTIVIPIFLHKGITNPATEVRVFSVMNLAKLCKLAGSSLTAFVPETVNVLLESLSSLEPSQFNYLSFHTEKLEISQEQLEGARLAASKATPMQEALDLCVRYVDDKSLEDLIPRVLSLLRTGVGLPTRVGTCKFLSSLTKHKHLPLQTYTTKLFRGLANCLEDHSPSVRKSAAGALAGLASFASKNQIKWLVNHLQHLYLSKSDDPLARAAVAVSLNEFYKISSDKFREFNKEILPIIVLGIHDKELSKPFEEVWDDIGGASTLRIYLTELVEVISKEVLPSNSWLLKKQAASATVKIAESVGSSLDKHAETLLGPLLDGFSGKIWDGKETLFDAVAAVCKASKDFLNSADSRKISPANVILAIMKEIKKTSKIDYRVRGLACLCSVLDSFKTSSDLDRFRAVSETVEPILESAESVESNKDGERDKDEEKEKSKKKEALVGIAFKCLTSSWPIRFSDDLPGIAERLAEKIYQKMVRGIWSVRLELLSALEIWSERLSFIDGEEKRWTSLCTVADKVVATIIEAVRDPKYLNVRKAALSSLLAWTRTFEGTEFFQNQRELILTQIGDAGRDTQLLHLIEPIRESLNPDPLQRTSKRHKNA